MIGPVGSGKSTLAKRLGKLFGLPVFHLDDLWNLPDGGKESLDVMDEKIEEIMQHEAWVIDGNYRASLPRRFEAADMVVWLNFDMEFCQESAKARHMAEWQEIAWKDEFFSVEENLRTAGIIGGLAEGYRGKVLEFGSRCDLTLGVAKIADELRLLNGYEK